MAGMMVPETAMHKNNSMKARQNQIRLTGKVPPVKPEPKAFRMQGFTDH